MGSLFDDREESAGRKFNDADLIGIPYRVVVSQRGLKEGQVEIKNRRTGQSTLVQKERLSEMLGNERQA